MTRERDRCTKVVHMSNDEKRKYTIILEELIRWFQKIDTAMNY